MWAYIAHTIKPQRWLRYNAWALTADTDVLVPTAARDDHQYFQRQQTAAKQEVPHKNQKPSGQKTPERRSWPKNRAFFHTAHLKTGQFDINNTKYKKSLKKLLDLCYNVLKMLKYRLPIAPDVGKHKWRAREDTGRKDIRDLVPQSAARSALVLHNDNVRRESSLLHRLAFFFKCESRQAECVYVYQLGDKILIEYAKL